jgi:hypothetical protein
MRVNKKRMKKKSRVKKRRRVVKKKRMRVKKVVTILDTVPPPTRGCQFRVFQTWLCIPITYQCEHTSSP